MAALRGDIKDVVKKEVDSRLRRSGMTDKMRLPRLLPTSPWATPDKSEPRKDTLRQAQGERVY